MNRPHVTFHINRTLDKQMIPEFVGEFGLKAGANFEKWVLEDHPKLKGKTQDINYINSYVDNFYSKNKPVLIKAKKDFQSKWDNVENEFLDIVDEIFSNQPWPKGRYRGYISIIQCGPRFLKTAEFQSSYKWYPNLISQVIHEMLHFQFYEAMKLSRKNINDDYAWTLSEIFNDVVQNEKEFVKIQGHKVGVSYPDHKKEFNNYKKIWQETKRAQEFIQIALNQK